MLALRVRVDVRRRCLPEVSLHFALGCIRFLPPGRPGKQASGFWRRLASSRPLGFEACLRALSPVFHGAGLLPLRGCANLYFCAVDRAEWQCARAVFSVSGVVSGWMGWRSSAGRASDL